MMEDTSVATTTKPPENNVDAELKSTRLNIKARISKSKRTSLLLLPTSWLICLTICNNHVLFAAAFPDHSLFASMAASVQSLPKQWKTTLENQTADVSAAVESDPTKFKNTIPFFRRQIHDVLPSVTDLWKQGKVYAVDVLESISSSRARTSSYHNTSSSSVDDEEWNNDTVQVLELNPNDNMTSSWLDKLARSAVISTGWITGLQAMATWFSTYQVVDELSSRLLSAESTAAIKTIQNILSNAQDHGLVDVFGKYPPAELAASVYALSRLQQAALRFEATALSTQHVPTSDDDDSSFWTLDVIKELAHYAKFASAAYGWKMDLAFSGRLHWGDEEALVKVTGISRDNVVSMQWQSRTHRPAYFIVREMDRKRIVLCIRGTWSIRDILTDLCCTAIMFETTNGIQYRAHQGMLEAARAVADTVQEIIAKELKTHPNFSLTIVGHSMGGGVAAVLGILWEDVFPEKIAVYLYGAPCVFPLEPSLAEFPVTIVSVVTQGDPMCTLSLGHIADLSMVVSQLCEQNELRQSILARTEGLIEEMDEPNLRWCSETMSSLRQSMNGDRLYPPGRILLLSKVRNDEVWKRHGQASQRRKRNGRADSRIAFRSVPPHFFREPVITPRMFDLSTHAPSRYESWLRRLLQQEAATTALSG